MQTRNKKYCVNSNTLKSKGNPKDECLRLSESSEMTALKDLENKENMQTRSVLQSKENHLMGKVASIRSKVRNEIIILEKRSALKSKENNLKEKSPTFSVIDNYDSKLQSRGITGKNEENKENVFINNSCKTIEKENVESIKRTLPLKRKAKVPNLMAMLNRKETVKESKYEDTIPECKTLRRKSTESELNNKNQGLSVRETSKINNPLLLDKKVLIKLTALKIKESKSSDIKDNTQFNIDDQNAVLNKDASKLNGTLESCREENKICDEKTSVEIEDDSLPVRAPSTRIRNKNISESNTEESNPNKTTGSDKNLNKINEMPNSGIESTEAKNVDKPAIGNKGNTLPIRAPSTRIRSKKNNSEGGTQENNLDITVSDKTSTGIRNKNISGNSTEESNLSKTTGSDKNLSKMPNSGVESTEAKNVEKSAVVNKGDTLPIRAPSTRIRSKKNNSGSSTQESNFNTTVSDKNVSKMNEKSNLEIENTEAKDVKKPSFVGKDHILPKRTQSARIKSKKANSEDSTELSNQDSKTIVNSVTHISKESETPESRRENKELKGNRKIVVNKRDPVPKKASARIRNKKVNTENVSQENNLNGNAIISNKNTIVNKTSDEKTPVVKTNILPNRTPSDRIRNLKTNSEENVSNDSGKILQISENLSNQSRLQEKVPVWKCREIKKSTGSNSPVFDFKTKRRSNRASLSRKRDVYEFSFEGNEKCVIKKKRRKQQVRKKKLKPLKKGLLTTDPLFEPTIPCITTKTFYSSKISKPSAQKPCNEIYNENHENNISFDGEDTNFEDITVDDAGYEASISVAESSCMTHINPLTSVLPTPKIYSRFLGPASTPVDYDERYGYNSILKNKDIAPQEEVKLCFGFDESDNENSIGLSPVQNLNQFSYLQHSSLASYNIEEFESAPTRFTLPTFKKPLPLMNGKENAQLKLKKRCTSTKNNHAKRRKLDKNSIVPDKDSLPPQAQDKNVSVLFDIEDEEVPMELNTNDISSQNKSGEFKILQLPLKIQESNVSILFGNENEASLESNYNDVLNHNKSGILKDTQLSNILSPEKSFSKPPRKSYDRKSLEAAKKKFIEEFAGGYPTTDAGSDYEDPEPPYVRKRKKRMESQKENSVGENSQSKFRLVSKRTNKASKKYENKEKQPSKPSNSTVNTKHIHKKKKPLKNSKQDDWVSDINSHFSEIEDMDLLIE